MNDFQPMPSPGLARAKAAQHRQLLITLLTDTTPAADPVEFWDRVARLAGVAKEHEVEAGRLAKRECVA